VTRLSEPTSRHASLSRAVLERTRQEAVDRARPLPSDEQSVIEQLTDDEARRFLYAILHT
jgi:hypothetical protein